MVCHSILSTKDKAVTQSGFVRCTPHPAPEPPPKWPKGHDPRKGTSCTIPLSMNPLTLRGGLQEWELVVGGAVTRVTSK